MFAPLFAFLGGLLTSGWAGSIGFFIWLRLMVIGIAAVKANEGVAYRYPVTLRLVK